MPKVNLYINNLDENVDDDYLREAFERFGTVLSAAVMKKSNRSNLGFGFVCFDSMSSAEEAIREMNGSMLMSKCIKVSVAENQQMKFMQKPARGHFRSQTSIRSCSPDSSRHSSEHNIPFENKNRPAAKENWQYQWDAESESSHVSSSSARSGDGRKYLHQPYRDPFIPKNSVRSNSPDSSTYSTEHKVLFERKSRPDAKIKWCNAEYDSFSQVSGSEHLGGRDGECSKDSNITRRIRSLYEDKLFPDVKFIIYNGGQPKSLMAHKAILAVGSPVLREKLFGNSVGYHATVMSEENISDITFDAFKNIVEYLYTDKVFFKDNASAVDILLGAKQYKVQSLIDRCESYFESTEITENNACSLLQVSISNNIESLKNSCVSFIQENTGDVIRSSDFKESPINTIRTICKLPKLNLRSEVELFEAIMLWADSCGREGANKRSFTDPLLKCIRFLTMNTEEFTSLTRKYPEVLTKEETVSLLMHIASPEARFPQKSLCRIRENRCAFSRPATSSKSVDARAVIPLRPFKPPQGLKNLKCVLEIDCLEGFYELESVKLSFQEPVQKGSRIVLIMSVTCLNTRFNLQESLNIQDLSSATVSLSKPIYMRPRDSIRIVANAQKIEQYKFYQFDEEELMSSNPCFTWNIRSSPSQNRLFFIKEVVFVPRLRTRDFAMH